ncbi:cobyrinic acid a,c-diamide synthase [Methanocella conradii HZ254]|uniref:Cobyrinate a,c-diamide synthase n=1 Tax=Methanocella conradii (strain DSM 24694 / JCM 17849 / CGMCC 1.5162 / HZ254) TaxID=1041930 RepID=H8I5E6_METCZ|nr:Ni-sirohydrochlorin a,c-diamide synthase [Methanocella conradii]AFC98840.1 cobyrinic acid a,c-diamide synthase [Methanocella conradii HZ254]MDI6897172.1 Ni-sirohydrochlorin a,c-diamide synthase [Methanocella conradii]
MMTMPRIILAGDRSSAGKTTISTGLMSILHESGLKVQPFKVGLDYIDPSYHSLVTGRQGENLDGFLMSGEAIVEAFQHSAEGADIAIIEGVRGLYEGLEAVSDVGSTAQIAKILKAPVILVVDAQSITRSTAAIVKGYKDFDKGINFKGVILNKVGSERHAEKARTAIEKYTGVEVLGAIPRNKGMSLTMRHLGLIPAREGASRVGDFEARISKIKAIIKEHVNIDRLVEIAKAAPRLKARKQSIFIKENDAGVRIGVALDEAFNFYYKDNVDLLTLKGAEVVYFSPLHDREIPDVDGLMIGGGYPEFFAGELSDNSSMRKSIAEASANGMPIYAECGGMMYLVRALEDENGKRYDMVGAMDGVASMKHIRHIGYVAGQFEKDTPIGAKGSFFKGHEFHYSIITDIPPDAKFAYRMDRGIGIKDGMDGMMVNNTLGSYTHLHAASYVPFAKKFVESCVEYKEQ